MIQSKSINKKMSERFHYTTDTLIDKPFNWKQVIRLLSYIKPYMKSLLPAAFVAVIINTGIRLILPILIGVYAIDRGITAKNEQQLKTIIIMIFTLYVISYVAGYFRIKLLNKLGQSVIYDIRKKLFTHVQSLSHRFFDERSAGSILVRIMNDTNSLQDLFTNGVINLLMDFLMLVGVVIILFTLSTKLTLAIVVLLPMMFFISTRLRKSIRMAWQYTRLKQSKLNSHLNESIQGIRVTKSFTQENENIAFFDGVNYENYQSWRNASRKSAMFRPFVDITNALGSAILIWYGTHLIRTDQLELGQFVSFAFYVGMFWQPISRMGQVYNQLLAAMSSSERIFEYLDMPPLIADKKGVETLHSINGHITFNQVEFAYSEGRKALNNISLEMLPGQKVALVGHTGSGKTTIANLISRFYDVTGGEVKIDGKDVRSVTLNSLRNQISVVLQDTFIFSGTIMDNIKFGNPLASDEAAIDAAKAIGADQFIQKLAKGYHTEVEERGNILSVGERQLLSFARALLADPKIIILDEATASIDTETEIKIQQALTKLLSGRTSIIIAHRLSTIRESDVIFVLDHGNIIEQGNHDELIAQKGTYYHLVESQFKMIQNL